MRGRSMPAEPLLTSPLLSIELIICMLLLLQLATCRNDTCPKHSCQKFWTLNLPRCISVIQVSMRTGLFGDDFIKMRSGRRGFPLSSAAAPRESTPCWQFTGRGPRSSRLTNNKQKTKWEIRQPPEPPSFPARSRSPTRCADAEPTGFSDRGEPDRVAGAGSPGAAKRSHFVWLLSLQSGLLSSADRRSSAARFHWRILLGTLGPSAGGPGGLAAHCARTMFLLQYTGWFQVWFRFVWLVPAAERFRTGDLAALRRGSRTPLRFPAFRLHNDGSWSGEDGSSPWLRSRIFGRICYQLLGSAAQPLWLGSWYHFVWIKGRIARWFRATLRVWRRYRGACCSCLGTKFSECVDSTLVLKCSLFQSFRGMLCIIFGSMSTTSQSRRSLLTRTSWFSATYERFHVIYSLIPTAHK